MNILRETERICIFARPPRRGEEYLFDQIKRIFDDPFAIHDIRDQSGLTCAFDGSRDHFLVFFAVAGKTAGHDFVALGKAEFQHIEVFVVYKIYFLLAIAAVTFFEFSSFGHG